MLYKPELKKWAGNRNGEIRKLPSVSWGLHPRCRYGVLPQGKKEPIP